MGSTYVITSGKGGVGKTTITANLGTALAMLNKKVVVIDADMGLRNLDIVLGLDNRVIYDIMKVAQGEVPLKKALIRDKKFNELFLLPAPQNLELNVLTPEKMKDICRELEQEFDFVLIDCPAGIEQGFQNAIAPAKNALVVTTPEPTAVRDADRVVGLLDNHGYHSISLIVNRLRPDLAKKSDYLDIETIVETLSIKLMGFVPEEDQVMISNMKGEPIVLKHNLRASTAYRNIAQRLNGVNVPLMPYEEHGAFKRLFRKLGL